MAAESLVGKPRLERPKPWAFWPLFLSRTGRMLVGADDGAIQNQPFDIGVSTQLFEQPINETALQPSIIPALDGLKGAEIRRQILPSRPGAGHPKQGIDETSIVRTWPTLALAATGDQQQNPRPLIIPKAITIPR